MIYLCRRDKWEKWIINGEESIRLTAEAVKEKAKEIPEDKLTEPEPYVAVPAIQATADQILKTLNKNYGTQRK